MPKSNPRSGSGFDDFLKQEGIFGQVQAKALKRARAEKLEEGTPAESLNKTRMARKMVAKPVSTQSRARSRKHSIRR
jgi:hypothetical protein